MTKTDLTQPTVLTGTTKPYSHNGRELGYPTANMASDTELADGVYLGWADLHSFHNHPAIIFIGTPTTVGDTDRRVEAYLLNIADKDYYNLPMTLRLEHYVRSNKTFDSIAELVKAMEADEQYARYWFASTS